MKSKKAFIIILINLYLLIINIFAYEKINKDYLKTLSTQYQTAYLKGEITSERIEREKASFVLFKSHVQDWLNSSSATKNEAVENDIDQLRRIKGSKLAEHFINQYNSINDKDKQGITYLLEDINSIIAMFDDVETKAKLEKIRL